MQYSIRPLAHEHDVRRFDCGNAILNQWLVNIARQHHGKHLSRTYVLVDDANPATVIAYYALSLRGLVSRDTLPPDFRTRLPANIPALTLARLAVARSAQGRNLGELLVVDALRRAKTVSALAGGRFVFVDAKPEAAEYYRRFGFVALPDAADILCISIADLP